MKVLLQGVPNENFAFQNSNGLVALKLSISCTVPKYVCAGLPLAPLAHILIFGFTNLGLVQTWAAKLGILTMDIP